jgi:Ulp1 family protease
LEKIGIKKSGHIYRILTRIQFDAKLINQNLGFFIKNQIKFNLNLNENSFDLSHSTSSLRVSDPKLVCCAFKPNKLNVSKIKNEIDLIKFLEKFLLKKYEKNFIFNGFDSLEYIFLQFFSSCKFDEEVLESKLHIYEAADRKRILLCLLNELKEVNSKLCLNISLNVLYDESLNYLFEEQNSNIYDNRRVDEGCKACLLF